MEVSKHVKSDSSSDESTDHHQEQAVKDEAGNITKRPYECTYCKRGFTNAQALGGHMNIHRKDRAKAKQNHHQQHHHANSSVPKPPHGDYYDPISSQLPNYNYVGPEAQRNYHLYQLPPMASSPNYYPQADYHENDFSASRLEIDEERVGPNLSLRIGSAYMEEDREVMRVDDDQEKDEVDLELRLGPDP